MIMVIKTGKSVYMRVERGSGKKIDKGQYVDELFWLLVKGIKDELATPTELKALVDEAADKVDNPHKKVHGARRNPITAKHKNVYGHVGAFDNGLEYCAHRDIDNCKWCEYSSDPEAFDGICMRMKR